MALVEQTHISHRTPLFVDELRAHASHPALITSDGVVTYAELADRVDHLALRLRGADGRRRLVLAVADNTVDAVIAYLAALRADAPVLLAPGSQAAAVAELTAAYDPDVVLDGGVVEERRGVTRHVLHPDLALLLSTSGSTGSPKLVRLSRTNLASNAAAIAQYLGLTPDDRGVTSLPLQYCYGLSVLNSHLHVGASIVLSDRSVTDPEFWDQFRATAATGFAGVPHTFDLLERSGFEQLDVPSLRYVTQAGGRMAPAMVRRLAELGRGRGWDLFVMYGQTEATARMAFLPPALAASHPHTIGVAIPGGRLSIAEPDADGVGELVYAGPNVMLGYAESPGDLALGAVTDELRTGDLARRTDDGLFEVVGRRSRFVKPFGVRVDLDRAEHLLARAGFAAWCAGDDDGLAVVTTGDPGAAAELLCDVLGLPRSKVVARAVAELPVLPNGKPDHAGVLREARRAGTIDRRRAPGGDSESRRDAVRSVLASVLGVEPTDGDTFVGLGGDSLSYVEASVQLEAIVGTLPRDWHTTPVGELAAEARPRRRMAATDTTVVLRAIGIVLIVGTHARLWQVPGGAHVLMAVAGFNFARFAVRSPGRLAAAGRVALPSMAWIGSVAAFSDKYGWPNAVLVHGFVERTGDRWGYWFVESLVQILVVLAVLFAVPAVRRAEAARPFLVAMAAVAVGLVVRFDVIEPTATYPTSRPHEVFWLFALGWGAAVATRVSHRVVITAVAAAAAPGFFGNLHRELLILAGVAAVVWLPTVPLPRLAQRAVTPLAAGSLAIYLTHYQVFPPIAERSGPAAAVAASLVVGVAVWAALSAAGAGWRRWRHRAERRPAAAVPAAAQ